MNRRIVAGVVMAAAMLPGCFLFGAEEEDDEAADIKAKPPVGGSGGEGFGGFGGDPTPGNGPGLLETDGDESIVLPINGPFALAQGSVESGVTLELWFRPLRVSEGGTACVRPPLPENVAPPECQATDLDFDVCGPIIRLEDPQGVNEFGFVLDGRCVQALVPGALPKNPEDPPDVLGPNSSRWTTPAGAWTHLALRAFQSLQGQWQVDFGVNATTGGNWDWSRGPLYLGDRSLRLGGVRDGPMLAAQFDEVRLRRDKLSENDLKQDARGAPLAGPLVSWWSFDDLLPDGSVTVLADHAAPDTSIDGSGLRVRAGGVSVEPPAAPAGSCPAGMGGFSLGAEGALVACYRVPRADEPGLEALPAAELCPAQFHLCRRDDPPLVAFARGPEGVEGVPGCFAIAALRASTNESRAGASYDESRFRPEDRTCGDSCSFADGDPSCGAPCGLAPTGADDDAFFEPERLAIGRACDVDRPYGVDASCGPLALPAIHAPENEAVNDCSQLQFVTDGVACCRD